MELFGKGPYRELARLEDRTLSARLSDEESRAVAKELKKCPLEADKEVSKIKEIGYEPLNNGWRYIRHNKLQPSFLEEEVTVQDRFISFMDFSKDQYGSLYLPLYLVMSGPYNPSDLYIIGQNIDTISQIKKRIDFDENCNFGIFFSSLLIGTFSSMMGINFHWALLGFPVFGSTAAYSWYRTEKITSRKIISLCKNLSSDAKDYLFGADVIKMIREEYDHIKCEKEKLIQYDILKDGGFSLTKQEFLVLGDSIKKADYKQLKLMATKSGKKLEELIRVFEFSKNLVNSKNSK